MTTIKINGQDPEDALAEAQLKVRLAEAQVSAAQRRIRDLKPENPDSDHHIALMSAQLRLHSAQQELKRVSELMGKTQFGDPITIGAGANGGGGGGTRFQVSNLDEALRKSKVSMDQQLLSFKKNLKESTELSRLTDAVKSAVAVHIEAADAFGAAKGEQNRKFNAFMDAGKALRDARKALLHHLGDDEKTLP